MTSPHQREGTTSCRQFHQRSKHSFCGADHKGIKFNLSCQCLFTLLGSGHIKAARKMLMKLTPGTEQN